MIKKKESLEFPDLGLDQRWREKGGDKRERERERERERAYFFLFILDKLDSFWEMRGNQKSVVVRGLIEVK